MCIVLFICLLLPLYTCENDYELNACNKIIIIIIKIILSGVYAPPNPSLPTKETLYY